MRWQNGITNAESDWEANIDSDHAPVVITCQFKYKKIQAKQGQMRNKVEPIEEGKIEEYNKELIAVIRKTNNTPTYKTICEALHNVVPNHFQTKRANRRNQEWAKETEELFEKRAQARKDGDWEKEREANKAFRKSLRRDKTKHLMETFDKELDLRSRWMGLRMLKKGYTPAPYHRRNQGGEHIPLRKRAEEAAEYLSKTQWGKEDGEREPLPTNQVIVQEVRIKVEQLEIQELDKAIK